MFVTVSDWPSREIYGRDKGRLFRDKAGFLTEPSLLCNRYSSTKTALSRFMRAYVVCVIFVLQYSFDP